MKRIVTMMKMIANKKTKTKSSHHMKKKDTSIQNLTKMKVIISNMIFSMMVMKFKLLEKSNRRMHSKIFLNKGSKFFGIIKEKIS